MTYTPTGAISMNLNNNKRLIASQILVELYEARQVEQLRILKAQVDMALEKLKSPAPPTDAE